MGLSFRSVREGADGEVGAAGFEVQPYPGPGRIPRTADDERRLALEPIAPRRAGDHAGQHAVEPKAFLHKRQRHLVPDGAAILECKDGLAGAYLPPHLTRLTRPHTPPPHPPGP